MSMDSHLTASNDSSLYQIHTNAAEIIVHIDAVGMKSIQTSNPTARRFTFKVKPAKIAGELCLGKATPFDLGSTNDTLGWNNTLPVLPFAAPPSGWYAVKVGLVPGVYRGWNNAVCSALAGISEEDTMYKFFPCRDEAIEQFAEWAAANELIFLHTDGRYRATLASYVDLDRVISDDDSDASDQGHEHSSERETISVQIKPNILPRDGKVPFIDLLLNKFNSTKPTASFLCSKTQNQKRIMTDEVQDPRSALNSANLHIQGSPDLIAALDPADRAEYLVFQKNIANIISAKIRLGLSSRDIDDVLIVILSEVIDQYQDRLYVPDDPDVQHERRSRIHFYIQKKYKRMPTSSQTGGLENDDDESNHDEEEMQQSARRKGLRGRNRKGTKDNSRASPFNQMGASSSNFSVSSRARISSASPGASITHGASGAQYRSGPHRFGFAPPLGHDYLSKALSNCNHRQHYQDLIRVGFNNTRIQSLSKRLTADTLASSLINVAKLSLDPAEAISIAQAIIDVVHSL
ncbi:hypothetical protein C8J56DRAFT_907002 [Mycena floridula]|nr:hypothetical protein C8J56DRAFT_907002 [Mycena floridula]